MHAEHSLTPEQQLCQSQGSRVFEYIRDASMENRPGALKSGGISNLQTLASLRSKAENIIAKREAKVADLVEDGPEEESQDEAATMLLAPAIGSIASQPLALAKKKAPKRKAKEKNKDMEVVDDGDLSFGGGASSQGSKRKDHLDIAAAEAFKKSDADLFQVVQRLGFVPDCFNNLTRAKMFCPKLGRSLRQAGFC